MTTIMYRLLKDLIDWKGNFYIKCKLGKIRVSSVLVLSLVFLNYAQCVHSESVFNKVQSQSGKSGRSPSGRTIFDHGIFRHDKPRDSASSFPSKSDIGSSTKDAVPHTCQSAHGCHSSDSTVAPPSPPTDIRDRYTYDRFKRSVTTLNFHPKPRNESKNVAVKPLRIFKYITEDDVLVTPVSSERQHVTIFQPIVTAAKNKNKSNKTGENSNATPIITTDNDTSRQQVIGGTKVNLKAKLNKTNHHNSTRGDQIISDNGATRDSNKKSDWGNASKSHQISKGSAASKPENILIFKPSLAIRKSNKTSLIPSGNHPPKSTKHNQEGGNSLLPHITAATSRVDAAKHDDESADPNSSTMNYGSLIHNRLYFDSVVMLNEEGQKQLHQQQQTVQANHEKPRKSSSSSNVMYSNDGGANGDDDEIKMGMFTTPSSLFSSKSSANSNVGTKESQKDENKASASYKGNNGNANGGNDDAQHIAAIKTSKGKNSSMTSDLVENLIQTIDAAIGGKSKKDKVIVTVVKSKKSKSSKKAKLPKQQGLDEDDIDQDGSERSRRSPFKVPMKLQQPTFINNNNQFSRLAQANSLGGQKQLARDALFRRNPGLTRIRSAPLINKNTAPRILTPVAHFSLPGKVHGPRTILPMKPMPMSPAVKQVRPNLALVPGPVGPGPVGPPIAAIKVTNLHNHNNANINKNHALSGKDLLADASRTVYSYKPLTAGDVILNHAASSYYSPTYKRFKKRFHNQIANMMDSQRELEDTIHRLEESRYQNRNSRQRLRNPGRNNREHSRFHEERERERHDRHDRDRDRGRERHHHHRSGHHGHHPHHRDSPIRGKKLGPKYAYPKNAENIQDILKYFDKESPFGGSLSSSYDKEGASPRRQQSSLPEADNSSPSQHPKLADLSGEFRDVHASLLKDIREFAKRPNLFGSSDKSEKLQSHPLYSHEAQSPFDPIDEIFGSKGKPVRDLIKPDLYSLENIRERIALKRGKLHGKFRDKDKDINSQHDEHHHEVEHQPNTDDEDGFYDSQRPSRHNSDGGQSVEAVKNSLFSKEEYDSPSTYIRREKHKDNDDSHTIFPSSHFQGEKDTIKENSNPFEYSSAEFAKAPARPSLNKPVVLKRPNEPFRVREAEPKKKPEHDYFWNTYSNGFEKAPAVSYEPQPPLVLKSPAVPSVLQPYNPYSAFGHPANPVAHSLPKPVSMEDEDIVEIHTGGPGSVASSAQVYPPPPDANQLKQKKLEKMYMDVLQQKMQLEAALLNPQTLPTIATPTLHHPHQVLPGMHPSASLHPHAQHNPLHAHQSHLQPHQSHLQPHQGPLYTAHTPYQITRIGHAHAPQISPFPQTPAATLSPLTGLTSITRRKKPMRMKIHIYPNGNGGLEQGLEAANLLAGQFGTSGFSASNPTGVVAHPPKDVGLLKAAESAIPSGPTGPLPTSPSGFGATSISGPTGPHPNNNKNKNVVLHLHVHRRNDMLGPLEVEAEGSAPVPATAKPLTYKEIFDEQMKKSEQQRNNHLSNHRQVDEEDEPSQSQSMQDTREREPNEDTERGERDKSTSMEVPIHDEKIEDVFHSIMKFRKKPDNRKKRS